MRYWREFVTSAPLSWLPVHAEPLRMCTNVVYFRVIRRMYRRKWNWLCVNQHPWQRTRGHGEWRHTSIAYYLWPFFTALLMISFKIISMLSYMVIYHIICQIIRPVHASIVCDTWTLWGHLGHLTYCCTNDKCTVLTLQSFWSASIRRWSFKS